MKKNRRGKKKKISDLHGKLIVARKSKDSKELFSLMEFNSPYLRETVVENVNCSEELLLYALNDEYSEVRSAAVNNPSAGIQVLVKAMDDSCETVRFNAVCKLPKLSDPVYFLMLKAKIKSGTLKSVYDTLIEEHLE